MPDKRPDHAPRKPDAAGEPIAKGKPTSDRAETEKVLEKGLPDRHKTEAAKTSRPKTSRPKTSRH